MIQSAQDYPILDLLSVEKDVKYIIQKYQREYVWNRTIQK